MKKITVEDYQNLKHMDQKVEVTFTKMVEAYQEDSVVGCRVELLLNGTQKFFVDIDSYDIWVQVTGDVHFYHLGSIDAACNENCISSMSLHGDATDAPQDTYKYLNEWGESYYFVQSFEDAVFEALTPYYKIVGIAEGLALLDKPRVKGYDVNGGYWWAEHHYQMEKGASYEDAKIATYEAMKRQAAMFVKQGRRRKKD